MASLAPALRKKLEDAVKEARDVAEPGARAALEQLAVHAAEPFGHLSPEDRELRNRLRARARQLGDARDARTGAHQIDHLVVECAYEHWHRMLFARFLAENGVLMANSEALGIENTPVTLEECEELAADEGAASGWELAGRYASRMLPQIFRPDAPVLAVHLPPERQRRLEQILANLEPETFKASDALGWVYQFWQAKKKDDVNASGVKIGADELPAVTQLFTEPYMVEFLLHNTLGAWWAGKVLAERPDLARTAKSEDELREACSLPGCSWTYLRFIRAEGEWRPAAGVFESWPGTAADLRVLDPCCGSGHFLVAAHETLVALRIREEQLSPAAASDAVLRDNIHGLEIDKRCTQLATFALALSAWTFAGSHAHRTLPEMHVACSGLAPHAQEAEWLHLAGDDVALRNSMKRLFALFRDAPVLGSLIDPTSVGVVGQQRELGIASFEQVWPLLRAQLWRSEGRADVFQSELGVTAKGIATAADILSRRFHLVVTNVPYLVRGKQSETLQEFASRNFQAAKNDIATCMIHRFLGSKPAAGTCVATVSPISWQHQSYYREFRTAVLSENSVRFVANLGPGAFESISGEVVTVSCSALSSERATKTSSFFGCDATGSAGSEGKAAALRTGDILILGQENQRRNADSRIVISQPTSGARPLSDFAESAEGLSSGDGPRYILRFWEVDRIEAIWVPLQTGPAEGDGHFGGVTQILRWEDGSGPLCASSAARIQGQLGWQRSGVLVSEMNNLRACLHTGLKHDKTCGVIIPKDQGNLAAIWSYCSSDEYRRAVRALDPALKVAPNSLVKVPFDLERWDAVAAEAYPSGLPAPESSDPEQWLFHGRCGDDRHVLQIGMVRLLGYEWPNQDESIPKPERDDDGIVCIPSVRGEGPAADRLSAYLSESHEGRWSTRQRDAAAVAAGANGKGLDWWLQNRFFEQHCQIFQHRPFIWHIWDGIKKDGFGALVNYHKLDRKLLETLTYTYLGDWIRRQQDDAARNVDGASERLDAARRLQQSLELILGGEKPYDIFVRWKPLHEQPIGWEPDLNDGVRVNIRPFMTVPDVDRKGAGILRYKPNIHWKKDRGTDPDDAPWYDLGPCYGESKGARINDHHLSLAEKRAARGRGSNP